MYGLGVFLTNLICFDKKKLESMLEISIFIIIENKNKGEEDEERK